MRLCYYSATIVLLQCYYSATTYIQYGAVFKSQSIIQLRLLTCNIILYLSVVVKADPINSRSLMAPCLKRTHVALLPYPIQARSKMGGVS